MKTPALAMCNAAWMHARLLCTACLHSTPAGGVCLREQEAAGSLATDCRHDGRVRELALAPAQVGKVKGGVNIPMMHAKRVYSPEANKKVVQKEENPDWLAQVCWPGGEACPIKTCLNKCSDPLFGQNTHRSCSLNPLSDRKCSKKPATGPWQPDDTSNARQYTTSGLPA